MRPIAVLSAMQDEVEKLHQIMQVDRSASRSGRDAHGQREYWVGHIYGARVIVAWSRWGKVAAASTATHIIDLYDPREIIFVGLAGSLKDEVRVGDIVVGEALVNHDLDASPLFPRYEVPLLGVTQLPTSPALTHALQASAEHFLNRQLRDVLTEERLSEFGIATPRLHLGEIASGDQFVADHRSRADLANRLPAALCVEMEGAAVAQVAFEHDIDFGILRTISDSSDDSAPVDFESFLTEIASPYSHGVLQHYLTAKTHQL